jgi:hypothetical protein
VRHQQPGNWDCGFFKPFQFAAQPLAVFIELLQVFITVHEVTILGFMKFHVINALVR